MNEPTDISASPPMWSNVSTRQATMADHEREAKEFEKKIVTNHRKRTYPGVVMRPIRRYGRQLVRMRYYQMDS